MDAVAEPFADVERIAVLHARGLGDLVFALPALAALRAAYPGARITLLGADWYPPFLGSRASPVDEVLVAPGAGVLDAAPSRRRDEFFAAHAARRYDLAVQLQGGGRNSNPYLLRLGARHTVGACTPDAPALERCVPLFHYHHEVFRCLEVVALAGAVAVGYEPTLVVTAADCAEAAAFLPVTAQPAIATIHPAAGDPRRQWPPERFAAVADALAGAGATVVVTAHASHRRVVDAVLAAMEAPAVDGCGRLSLGGLAGLLARSAVVVSNDSGPLHLAEAVGTATVGLYWCGNLINAGPAKRGRHRPLLSWQLECPVCGLDCTQHDCSHDASFLLRIGADEVREQALALLAEHRPDRPAQRPGQPWQPPDGAPAAEPRQPRLAGAASPAGR